MGRLTGTMLGLLLALVPGGCLQRNEDHCGNQRGNATCEARDPDRPFCSVCFEQSGAKGCTDQVVPPECRAPVDMVAGDSGSTTAPSSSSTSMPEATETTAEPSSSDGLIDTTTSSSSAGEESTSTGIPEGCGNGVVEPGETCDGTDLAGETCSSIFEQTRGALACTDACQYDYSGCCTLPGGSCADDDDCCGASTCQLLGMGGLLECST